MHPDPDFILEFTRRRWGPAWRWEAAQEIAAGRSHSGASASDAYVKQAVAYLSAETRDHVSTDSSESHKRMAMARTIWDDEQVAAPLKILLLADVPAARIVERLKIDADILALVENLWFDVRPLLAEPCWIFNNVIQPEMQRGATTFATEMQAALAGGPLIAESLLDTEHKTWLERSGRLVDQQTALAMKAKLALALPLGKPEDATRYLRLHILQLQGEKRLQLEERRFRHRCEQDLFRRQEKERRSQQRSARGRQPADPGRPRTVGRVEAANIRYSWEVALHRAAVERASRSPLAELRWADPKATGENGKTAEQQEGPKAARTDDTVVARRGRRCAGEIVAAA